MDAPREDKYTILPVQEGHMCFACVPANRAGLRMRFVADRDRVVSCLTVPDHLRGWSTMVHGGVVSTILDEIMSWSAIHRFKSVILTKSLSVAFKKTVHVGHPLKAVGTVLEIKSEREAIMKGELFSATEEELYASAEGVFALIKPKVALKLGIVDEQALKELLPEIEEELNGIQ